MVGFMVNGQRHDVGVDGNTPLLWVLREHLKLTGTKFGCGIASCGACTVHIDGEAVRSCAMPVSLVAGKSVTTIEGLSPDGSHPLHNGCNASALIRRGRQYLDPGVGQEPHDELSLSLADVPGS